VDESERKLMLDITSTTVELNTVSCLSCLLRLWSSGSGGRFQEVGCQ